MKTQTEKILKILRIVAWIAFVGSVTIFGLTIATVVISIILPDAKINFSGIIMNQAELRKTHLIAYLFIFSFTLTWAFLNIQLWKSVKNVLYKINMQKPFSMEVANVLEKIGFLLLSIWAVEFISDGYIDYLSKHIEGVEKGFKVSLFYLFNAGIVYIVSQIFKRGVELQEENELTV
ncbi:hypothetical protein EMA8858_00632 [Emticicia aquatica]|uniref:DUF2975 domain-containing protein n=1 Tax=Emticicia aquatica TaxID=1681835 RepID=A0ABN8EUD7_9BACT|nr:DUF2975 domain-containing protein [Emticicia aquatica]CAH0994522.1 hypothetical protein EMA8858_00632 [Emticicia aquatica]